MKTIENRIHTARLFRDTRHELLADSGRLYTVTPGERHFAPEPELTALKRRERALMAQTILSEPMIHGAIRIAEREGALGILLEEAKGKIRTSTTALRDSDEIALLGDKVVEGENPLFLTVKEEWGQQVLVNGIKVAGSYTHASRPEDRIIRISAPRPTIQDELFSLATEGRTIEAHYTGNHERLHAIQFNIGAPNIPPELLEAQAYRVKSQSHTDMSHDRLVNHVIIGQVYTDLDARKFSSAVWSVDRLVALGFSPEQIVTIISKPGDWDQERGVWNRIDATIAGTMEHLGIGEEALERKLMIIDLENKIAREEARLITQEVLGDAYREMQKRGQGKHVLPQQADVFVSIGDETIG